jgi:hypothetical protein
MAMLRGVPRAVLFDTTILAKGRIRIDFSPQVAEAYLAKLLIHIGRDEKVPAVWAKDGPPGGIAAWKAEWERYATIAGAQELAKDLAAQLPALIDHQHLAMRQLPRASEEQMKALFDTLGVPSEYAAEGTKLYRRHLSILKLFFLATSATAEEAPKARAEINGGCNPAKPQAKRDFTDEDKARVIWLLDFLCKMRQLESAEALDHPSLAHCACAFDDTFDPAAATAGGATAAQAAAAAAGPSTLSAAQPSVVGKYNYVDELAATYIVSKAVGIIEQLVEAGVAPPLLLDTTTRLWPKISAVRGGSQGMKGLFGRKGGVILGNLSFSHSMCCNV